MYSNSSRWTSAALFSKPMRRRSNAALSLGWPCWRNANMIGTINDCASKYSDFTFCSPCKEQGEHSIAFKWRVRARLKMSIAAYTFSLSCALDENVNPGRIGIAHEKVTKWSWWDGSIPVLLLSFRHDCLWVDSSCWKSCRFNRRRLGKDVASSSRWASQWLLSSWCSMVDRKHSSASLNCPMASSSCPVPSRWHPLLFRTTIGSRRFIWFTKLWGCRLGGLSSFDNRQFGLGHVSLYR